jgi:LVIVD repeat
MVLRSASNSMIRAGLGLVTFMGLLLVGSSDLIAAGGEHPKDWDYTNVRAAPAPETQDDIAVDAKSAGCKTCHASSDNESMHETPAVKLGCVDCHGGDPKERWSGRPEDYDKPDYIAVMKKAHVLPRYMEGWNWPSSANPQRAYTLFNKEAPEFIRFTNPSDYRVARAACGACHMGVIEAAERSLMATGAMLWGGAGYNNGIVKFKNYVVGEAYTSNSEPACIVSPSANYVSLKEGEKTRPCQLLPVLTDDQIKRGALPVLYPLPTWATIPPGDVFRVFERGGRNVSTQFAEVGLPNPTGSIQRLEEPGRPDLKQSNRGPGTGIRVAIPVLNIHKTRLNDPFMWFQGTNDQPGDYRNSGCAGCHVVYANDREPRHSLTWAKYGRDGQSATVDPTIANRLEGERPHHIGEHDEGYIKKRLRRAPPAHGAKQGTNLGEGHGNDHGAGGKDDGHGTPKGMEPAGDHASKPADDKHAAKPGAVDPFLYHVTTKAQDYEAGPQKEKGHPIKHAFTRSIPTAQCMNCHMHQPNIFLNTYLGYIMWDYESDAPAMWPGPENRSVKPPHMSDADFQRIFKQQHYPTSDEIRTITDRNPEAAAARGLWADVNFLRNVYDQNEKLETTQFADYHGHGWNFRAIFKRDREGNLLDADGNMATYGTETANIVLPDDPEKFRRKGEGKFVDAGTNPGKSVHMMDIHAEKGMQCVDCHFSQDSHGNGLIYGEVANAIEIGCKDCHGTPDALPNLLTSNVAAPPEGRNLALIRNPDGQRRFEWFTDEDGEKVLIQRSLLDPKLEWRVSLVKQATDRGSKHFNMKAARAKTVGTVGDKYGWGPAVTKENRAHDESKFACFTCHLSWTTSCGGCHLPIEANWKTKSHKYEGEETRNFATYNPQVARDEMFQIGRHQTTKGNMIAPVRSTSALILSSTNVNRERIYVQQPPISSAGFSSQAFAPHFPHTVRTNETKTCSDCHLSDKDDNNAIMTQTLNLGTNFVNFVGLHAWSGLSGGFQATRVTEWDEPQAVVGSYLHRYAYPDFFKQHVEANGKELRNWTRGKIFDKKRGWSGETQHAELFENVVQGTKGKVGCLQLRGEYMFVAEGKGGFQAYDVASIGNKGFSERIITAPFSKLGHDTKVGSANATCVALSTTQPISYKRNVEIRRDIPENQEQAMHPLYQYAVVSDSEEGMILVDVDGLNDGEFRNNFFKRALTWNPDGVLNGARHVHLAGHIAYFTTANGLAVVDLADPMMPKLKANIALADARASAIQFRYLWVSVADGVKLFDVTDLGSPVEVPSGFIPLANAQKIYLARTYAYIAAKADGLIIMDVKNPARPSLYEKVTFGGQLNDAEDVIVASTNASAFAYVADGRNGVKVIQLTSPSSQPNFYGFSPKPKPELISWAKTPSPALSLSKGLDRDRGVDETGGQQAVFGRLGSRPFMRSEMEKLFKDRQGQVYKVNDVPSFDDYLSVRSASAR